MGFGAINRYLAFSTYSSFSNRCSYMLTVEQVKDFICQIDNRDLMTSYGCM